MIAIESKDDIPNKKNLLMGLSTLTLQKTNTHLLDVDLLPRYKLWRYNQRYDFYLLNPEHEKIKNRKVEAPVVIDKDLTRRTDTLLKQFMINNGYFYAKVTDSILPLKYGEGKVKYDVNPGKVYFIKNIIYTTDDPKFTEFLNKNKSQSLLKEGQIFRNTDFGSERERLYKLFREQSFYAMKSENIWCELDTINRSVLIDAFDNPLGFDISSMSPDVQNDSVNVYINFTETRDSYYDKQFFIGKVFINFRELKSEVTTAPINEVLYRNILFRYRQLPVNKDIIVDNIFIQPGKLYSSILETSTYNRLNQLGAFQFVNIQFERNGIDSAKLDCYIDLTLSPKHDLQSNLDLSNSDDYLLGLGASINYGTKNLFHRANKLNLRSQYSIEYNNDNTKPFPQGLLLRANNLSSSANITFPKFLLPFKVDHSRNNFPFTILAVNYNRVNRVGNFRLVNTSASLAYNWKETAHKSWLVTPVFLSFTNVPESALSESFKEQIANSSFLQNTYANNLIQGENIQYEYRSDVTGLAVSSHTLKLGLEESGLLLRGVNYLVENIFNDSISPIAQYVRADIDYRYYYTRSKYQWATRLMIGAGLPTFNDLSLPFIKQYSQGGAYSNRGWQLRRLGPGRQPIDVNGARLIDRTGDLKLEFNTEYRFKIVPLFEETFNLNGAAFVDAGNIWLTYEDSTNVGAQFKPKYFWQDIAISTGLGMRLDFSFFIFRLDYGWPIKFPYKLENNGWDFNSVRLNSGQWNLAIGYPF